MSWIDLIDNKKCHQTQIQIILNDFYKINPIDCYLLKIYKYIHFKIEVILKIKRYLSSYNHMKFIYVNIFKIKKKKLKLKLKGAQKLKIGCDWINYL